MKVALAQINATIGDFQGNTEKILDALKQGEAAGAELVVVPELAICGYPPRDLVLRESLLGLSTGLLQAVVLL